MPARAASLATKLLLILVAGAIVVALTPAAARADHLRDDTEEGPHLNPIETTETRPPFVGGLGETREASDYSDETDPSNGAGERSFVGCPLTQPDDPHDEDGEPLEFCFEVDEDALAEHPWRVYTCENMGFPSRGGILADDCWGTYPTSNYDMTYDEGGTADVGTKVFGFLLSAVFSLAKALAQVAFWMIGWAYDYDVGSGSTFGDTGESLAGRLGGVVQSHDLYDKVWFGVIAWAGFAILRGRLSNAGGELLLSIFLAMLGLFFIESLTDTRDAALDGLRYIATSPISIMRGDDAFDPFEPDGEWESLADNEDARDDLFRRSLIGPLHVAFVEKPYEHINWGEPIDGHPCASFVDDVIASGPWNHRSGSGNDARRFMDHENDDETDGETACNKIHRFNESPSANRLFAAVLYFVATFVLLVLLLLVSLTVVLMKLGMVLLFAIAPIVVPIAVLPGAGRKLFWSWLMNLAGVFLGVASLGFVLSFVILVAQSLLSSTDGDSLIVTFVMMDMLVVAGIIARKRVLAASANFSRQVADRLSHKPMGGTQTAGWMGGGGGGGGGVPAALAGAAGGGLMAGGVKGAMNELPGSGLVRNSVDRRRSTRASAAAAKKHKLWEDRNGLRGAGGGTAGDGGGSGSGGPVPGRIPGMPGRAYNAMKNKMPKSKAGKALVGAGAVLAAPAALPVMAGAAAAGLGAAGSAAMGAAGAFQLAGGAAAARGAWKAHQAHPIDKGKQAVERVAQGRHDKKAGREAAGEARRQRPQQHKDNRELRKAQKANWDQRRKRGRREPE